MANKQIYAALQIADYEVRLVVGEFHETRFNILRVEKERVSGIENLQIVNEGRIIGAITKVIDNASTILGYRIERVLLVVPSVDVVRQTRKVNVSVANNIQLSDIQRGINQATDYRLDDQHELVNIGGMKYSVNGISSRTMPLNESCTQFSMEVDLFFASKAMLYNYVGCVEKAGIEIMDICLDGYAIAEEAAIFEQTIENYMVLINLERTTTTLSLFSSGKLLNSEIIYEGYGKWVSALKDSIGLKNEVAARLLFENAQLVEKYYSDAPIFLWASAEKEKTLSLAQLQNIVQPLANDWVKQINDAIAPINEMGILKILMCGDGCEIVGMKNLIKQLDAPSSIYVPQTIGACNTSLAPCLGMFYAWREINNIRNKQMICTQQSAVVEAVNSNKKRSSEESGFTKKLMKIIMNEK